MTLNSTRDIVACYRRLDRSLFLDNAMKCHATEDRPLPIGYEQTISQPSLVLQMTLALNLNPSCRVLEIGTGSGYQTALLAQLVSDVFTVERIPELSLRAQAILKGLGYTNIRYMVGDGSRGWPEFAPYDRIIVTAAAAQVPEALLDQLSPGGRMVVPVGWSDMQELLLIHRTEDGEIKQNQLGLVRFVELVGDYGWSEPFTGM